MSDTVIAMIIGTATMLIAAFFMRKLFPRKNKVTITSSAPKPSVSFDTHIAPPSNRQRYTPARRHRVRFTGHPVKPLLDPLTGRPLKFKKRKKGDH